MAKIYQLYRLIVVEEQRKQKERAERYAAKQAGTLVAKEHKFWDTQVKKNRF